jgi:hypothetical protein
MIFDDLIWIDGKSRILVDFSGTLSTYGPSFCHIQSQPTFDLITKVLVL